MKPSPKTFVLLTGSALLLGLAGLVATFLPQEILTALGVSPDKMTAVVIQLLGALWLGFAMINWMNRRNLLGGIYNRPLALGNFLHFFAGTMALLKGGIGTSGSLVPGLLLALYGLFALGFGWALFAAPGLPASPDSTGSPGR